MSLSENKISLSKNKIGLRKRDKEHWGREIKSSSRSAATKPCAWAGAKNKLRLRAPLILTLTLTSRGTHLVFAVEFGEA
jgi:hypothetical protein